MSISREMPPWADKDFFEMDQQRQLERSGKTRYGRVVETSQRMAQEQSQAMRTSQSSSVSEDDEVFNGVEQHPLLDQQLWDGAAEKLSVDPSYHPHAKMDLENIQREQKMEKQLRLTQQLDLDHVNRPVFHPKPF